MTRPCTHWFLAVLAAAGFLLVAGCEKKEQAEQQPSTTETTDEQEAPQAARGAEAAEPPAPADQGAARPPAGKEPVIKLIEPGAEPHKPLRYKLVEGAKEKMVMTTDMSIQAKEAAAIEVPTIAMTLDMVVTEVMSEDQARYEFELVEVKVAGGSGIQPQMVELMQQSLDKVKGMKGQALVNSRGINSDVKLNMPDGVDPQMKQMLDSTMQNMDQMSSPLPEEPVGKGAKWELHQQIEQNGMRIEQVTLFELVELDGDKGTLKTTITQKADKQQIQVPGAGGATAELLEYNSAGGGEIAFDLANLVPETSVAIKSDYSMNVNAMGKQQTLTAHMEIAFRIDRK